MADGIRFLLGALFLIPLTQAKSIDEATSKIAEIADDINAASGVYSLEEGEEDVVDTSDFLKAVTETEETFDATQKGHGMPAGAISTNEIDDEDDVSIEEDVIGLYDNNDDEITDEDDEEDDDEDVDDDGDDEYVDDDDDDEDVDELLNIIDAVDEYDEGGVKDENVILVSDDDFIVVKDRAEPARKGKRKKGKGRKKKRKHKKKNKKKKKNKFKKIPSSGVPTDVITCVYCDQNCANKTLMAGYHNPNDYFEDAVGEMQRAVKKTLDKDMSFELRYVILPMTIKEMKDNFDYKAKTAWDLISAVNDKFWDESGFYDLTVKNGCDLDYLAVSEVDDSWKYMGPMTGIANMFKMCLKSYSLIKMSNSPYRTSSLMLHELGHMLGMYHDGPMHEDYVNMADHFEPDKAFAECRPQYDKLKTVCTEADVGCGSDSGSCVMNKVIGAPEYSECSVGYYEMYRCLMNVMPSVYTDDCIRYPEQL